MGKDYTINKDALPKHIAIIMDGNGRWAKKQGLLRVAGHEKGTKAVREAVEGCAELGVKNLTLYAFHWTRYFLELEATEIFLAFAKNLHQALRLNLLVALLVCFLKDHHR